MARVEVEYTDYSKHGNKGRLILEGDKAFNPYTWKPPINWEGYIGGEKISFVQTSASGYSEGDYDFSQLPEKFKRLIPEIVSAIDDAMRTMD